MPTGSLKGYDLYISYASSSYHRQNVVYKFPGRILKTTIRTVPTICFIILMVACNYQSVSARDIPAGKEKGFTKAYTNDIHNQRRDTLPGAKKMTKAETYDHIPADYDMRLTHIIAEPMTGDVIVSFYYMAVSKNPRANYRWELHSDGRLFVTHHSGKNISSEITFDRPLPKKPVKILSKNDITALYAQLKKSKFFGQPKFQKIFVEGGSYTILRARDKSSVHEVVYENVESPLIKYLYSITQ